MNLPLNYLQQLIDQLSKYTEIICANQSTVYPAWKNKNPFMPNALLFTNWLEVYLYENEDPLTNGPQDPTWGAVFSAFISPIINNIAIYTEINWQLDNAFSCSDTPITCAGPWWDSNGNSLFTEVQQTLPLNFTCSRPSCGETMCTMGPCSSPSAAATTAKNLISFYEGTSTLNFCSFNQQLFNAMVANPICQISTYPFTCNCSGSICTTTQKAPPIPSYGLPSYSVLTANQNTNPQNNQILCNLSNITPPNFFQNCANSSIGNLPLSNISGICSAKTESGTYVYAFGICSSTNPSNGTVGTFQGFTFNSSENTLTPIEGTLTSLSKNQAGFFPITNQNYLYYPIFNIFPITSLTFYCDAIESDGSLSSYWNIDVENFNTTPSLAPPYSVSLPNSEGTQFLYYCSPSGVTAYSFNNASSSTPNSVFLNIAKPCSVAFTPDGSKAYITSQEIPGVVIYDTATNQQLGIITLSNAIPSAIVITSQGTAYVTGAYLNGQTAPIYVFDTSTNAPSISQVLGSQNFPQPQNLLASSDGNYIFVAFTFGGLPGVASNTPIYVIDTQSNQLITTNFLNNLAGITII